MGSHHILIIFLLFVLSCFFSKSRVVSFFAFVYMWLLWGWNAWNGDYEAYEEIYLSTNFDSIWTTKIEKGYFLINWFFNRVIGLDYSEFLILFSFCILGLMYYLSTRICNKIGYFTIIYFVIFILEYVYMRNALSHVLLLYIFLSWIYNDNINKKRFVLYIVLCSFIHASSFIFIVFVFAINRSEIFDIKSIVRRSLLLFCFGFFLFNFFVSYLGGFFLHKLNAYSGHSGISNSFIGLVLLVFLSVYFYYKCVDIDKLTIEQQEIRVRIINVNLLCLFFLTIFYFIPYFARSFRLLLMFNVIGYLYFFKFIFANRYFKLVRFVVICFYFIFTLLLLQKATHLWSTYPLFNVNQIFGIEYYETIN